PCGAALRSPDVPAFRIFMTGKSHSCQSIPEDGEIGLAGRHQVMPLAGHEIRHAQSLSLGAPPARPEGPKPQCRYSLERDFVVQVLVEGAAALVHRARPAEVAAAIAVGAR